MAAQCSRRRERGQSLVELALILPVFLILTLAVVDFGMALRAYVTVTNAAREGARYAVVDCDSSSDITSIKSKVVDSSSGLLTAADVSLDADSSSSGNQDCTSTLPAAGGSIKVSATYTYNLITPLGNLVTSLSGPITLSTSTTMRAEN